MAAEQRAVYTKFLNRREARLYRSLPSFANPDASALAQRMTTLEKKYPLQAYTVNRLPSSVRFRAVRKSVPSYSAMGEDDARALLLVSVGTSKHRATRLLQQGSLVALDPLNKKPATTRLRAGGLYLGRVRPTPRSVLKKRF